MRQNVQTNEYSYTVIYKPVGKKGYEVLVPLWPGLVTYGRTFSEAQEMTQDAIRCHLNGLKKDRQTIPNEYSLLEEKMTVALVR
jgi:predicted RNase H-like HicB family nuclease